MDSHEETLSPTAPLLSLSKLCVGVSGAPLLDPMTFDLHAGDIVAVKGPSGCGKTTLLRTVAGLLDPIGGAPLLRGRPPHLHGWAAYRRQVLLVQQTPVLLPGTVRENLARPFAYRTANAGFDEMEASRWLERFQIGKARLGEEARLLSVGQQQRVCLIRALLVRPAVFLLDEPTGSLDEDNAALVEDAFLEVVRGNGCCALVSSHSPEQVRRWCSRAVDLPLAPGKHAEETEAPCPGP